MNSAAATAAPKMLVKHQFRVLPKRQKTHFYVWLGFYCTVHVYEAYSICLTTARALFCLNCLYVCVRCRCMCAKNRTKIWRFIKHKKKLIPFRPLVFDRTKSILFK